MTSEQAQQLDAWCAPHARPIRSADDPLFDARAIRWRAPDERWSAFIRNEWWGRDNLPEDPPEQIDLRKLRDHLLSFGGHAVCMARSEPDLRQIVERGQFWHGNKALRARGVRGQCHTNSAALWNGHPGGWKGGRLVLATGYAMSEDGMWRQHSWCVCRRPRSVRIVETTMGREAYFGFVMTDIEAARFYQSNVLGRLVV